MPSNCYLGALYRGYAMRHNPFAYFTELRNDPARCAAHVVPFRSFSSDISTGQIPNFSWITPNLCNDMHDCSAATGDRWLSGVVPQILASQAWREGGLLFITFDEGSSARGCCGTAAGGQIVTLVISPLSKPGYVSTVAHTHYGLLRTIEDSWHLGELDNAACSCSQPLFEFF
jgi:phosphatidylinositol-3-phosphatase